MFLVNCKIIYMLDFTCDVKSQYGNFQSGQGGQRKMWQYIKLHGET
jgi:hypothetical protein